MRPLGTAAALLAAMLWWSGAAAAADDDDGEDILARGERLFAIGGCTNCHTAKNGPLLAGGDAIKSPYGDFFAPNITPDPEHGIGGWSEEDFIRAMQEGRAPDGSAYYPAFPYTSYTRMGEADLRALKAFLDTLPPVARPSRAHALEFPFNQRWAMRLWQWTFFEPARFEPDPAQDEQWNRGAYLVQGPGHCAECHTPRNFAGALDRDMAFAGALLPGDQKVPDITSDPGDGLGTWSRQDIETLLQLGMTPEGDFVSGEMAKVVSNGTSKLPPDDVAAIAAYLESLPAR